MCSGHFLLISWGNLLWGLLFSSDTCGLCAGRPAHLTGSAQRGIRSSPSQHMKWCLRWLENRIIWRKQIRFTQEATKTEEIVASIMSSFFSCSFMCFWLGMWYFFSILIYKYIHWNMLSNSICGNKLYISISFFFFCQDTLDLGFSLSFGPVVFNQGWFHPLRNSWQCLETFLVVAAGDSVHAMGIQWAETREAAEHLTMHRLAPQTGNAEMLIGLGLKNSTLNSENSFFLGANWG